MTPSGQTSRFLIPDALLRSAETMLHHILELTLVTARLRGLVTFGFLLFLWTVYGFVRHPFPNLGGALVGLLVPANVPEGISPFAYLLVPILRAYFSPDVLVHVIAMVLPFFLALEFAAIYQADIYELPRVGIARKFIFQSSFGIPDYQTLRITDETIGPDQKRSPMILIGGPGVVSPNLEYAVVFERPDGSPHFIRAGMPKSQRTLIGFERLRRIIDTRDHTFHYDSLVGRTKDGIKINIQDINLLFSIWRSSTNNPIEQPYPAYRRDVYWLTYHQPTEKWSLAMTELVEEHMLRFIQQNNFGSLLAAVGEPEIRRQIDLETTIQGESWREPLRRPLIFIFHREMPRQAPVPDFVPRPQLSNFFRGFTQEFPLAARQRGLRLEWINVGTWQTPEAIILDQHVEAWQKTTENLARGNPRVLDEVRNQARIREYTRIIQQNILLSYARFASQGFSDERIIYEMLKLYEEKLSFIRSKYLQQNRPVPPSLNTAYLLIHQSLLNWYQQNGAVFL